MTWLIQNLEAEILYTQPLLGKLELDNNVFASDFFDKIIDEIKDCGFGNYEMSPSCRSKIFRKRDYIGKPHRNRKFIRAIQATLNSTHGKRGRGKQFFEAAFGKNMDESVGHITSKWWIDFSNLNYNKNNRVVR